MGETPGLDEQWYGITVYKLVGPRLGYMLSDVGNAVVRPAGITFELFLGPHHIRYNKLRGSLDSPVHAFPRPSRAAHQMAETNRAQMELPLTGIDVDVTIRPLVDTRRVPPTEWILGHMGSSAHGLVSAYLCAPWTAIDGEIVEWRTWIPIFHHGRSMPILDSVPAPGLPEPIDVEEAPLRLRRSDHANQRDGE
jgi:hypothetical protein